MKKTVCLILSLVLGFSLFVTGVGAVRPNIVDDADLLTPQQEHLLETTTDVIRDDHDFDAVIVTVNSINGSDIETFADDYYDYNGYGVDFQKSGVLFLVDMENRKWFISTTGMGIELISDSEISYIEQKAIPYLSRGEYSECFAEFLGICKEILELDSQGLPFSLSDDYNESPQSFNVFKNIIIALVVGFVIAFIIVMTMKGKLKTVRSKVGASDYVSPGSMNVTESNEIFLYRHVNRTPRQQNNSKGRSGAGVRVGSSGRSHSGRGGSF